MAQTWQVVLAGEGGQGLIVGGVVLAKAAVKAGKNAVQGQTYGIQSRGGYSEAEVIISDSEIYYPKCNNPNIVLALTRQAYDRYSGKVSDKCLIVCEEEEVAVQRPNDIAYPFKKKALGLGNLKVINSMALGVILKYVPVVERDSLEEAIYEQLPAKIHDINLKAFRIGLGAE